MGYTFFELIDFWNIFEFKNDFEKPIDVGDMLQTTLKKKKVQQYMKGISIP